MRQVYLVPGFISDRVTVLATANQHDAAKRRLYAARWSRAARWRLFPIAPLTLLRLPRGVRAAASAVLLVSSFVTAAPAAGVGQTGRRTTDRGADLIAALLDRQMGEMAESICIRHLAQAATGSEAAAGWAIRLSSVRTAIMLGQEELTVEMIQQAAQPPAQLLASYPDHPRQLWLRTQIALVDLAVAQHAAVRLAVSGGGESLRESALEQVAAALRQLRAIDAEASEALPLAESGQDAPKALAGELVALRQTLGRERIDALLLRSRLYAEGTADAVAAATDAETAANALLAQLSQDAVIRSEVLRQKVESILRAGDPARAASVLQPLQHDGRWPSASSGALAVRIALAQDDMAAAQRQLQSFYGSDPAAAPPSMEMDLARLAFLLRTAARQPEAEHEAGMREVSDWLATIQRRGGAYARRRGEAETLARVRIDPGGGDVRLLAAQAADQLRQGHALRGGEMLSQAAVLADRPDDALHYAAQAAAALAAVHQYAQAAEVLVQVSQRHADHPSAAETHLQAAWLWAEAIKSGREAGVEPLESVLVETMQRWPGSQQHRLAQQWLIRMLESTGQFRRAARLVAPQEVDGWTQESVATAGRLWRRAVRTTTVEDPAAAEDAPAAEDGDAAEEVVDEALTVMRGALDASDPAGTEAAEQLVWTAAVMASPDRLRADSWPLQRVGDAPALRFWAGLLEFRRGGLRPDTLPWKAVAALSATDGQDAVQRLIRDGLAHPNDRDRNGRAILRLIDELTSAGNHRTASDQARARALCWTGQWQHAWALLKKTIDASPGDAAPLRTAAEVLGQCSAAEARREAVSLWNRIAAGLPQGSPPWHEAKLSAAGLLTALGDRQEARTLARYVLLTQPPEDAALRARYQALSQ